MARAVLRKRRKHVAPYLSKAGAHASRGARFSTEPARPASGTWCGGLAARLAVPRIADPYRTLSRSRAPALLATLVSRALLRSQAGPHAGPWLTAIPCDTATNIPPQAMQVALRHRLRLPLPVCPDVVEPWMLSATMPSLAREQACWPDEPKSSSVPGPAWREPKVRSCQQAVARPHDRGRHPSKRSPVYSRRLVYGATANGGALCCDATLVFPPYQNGSPASMHH